MPTVAVPTELRPGERRVALVPDLVGKLTALGVEVRVQSGAGLGADATDEAYRQAGAEVVVGDVLSGADVVLAVNSLSLDQLASMKRGAVALSFLAPLQALDKVAAARDGGVTWLPSSYNNALQVQATAVSAVPEPQSLLMLLAGLGIVGAIVLRRRVVAV